MFAFCKSFPGSCAQQFDRIDAESGNYRIFFACAEFFCLIDLVVETVKHEIQQIGNNRFCPFRFQQFHQMVIGGRGKFDEDFADDAHSRFGYFGNRNSVEIFDHTPAHLLKGKRVQMSG